MVKKAIKIIAQLETADHDGYCSGNECEYNIKEITHFIRDKDIPPEFADFPVGNIKIKKKKSSFNWIPYLPEQSVNLSGSFFCTRSLDCKIHGNMERHSYRYTILCVEMINDL